MTWEREELGITDQLHIAAKECGIVDNGAYTVFHVCWGKERVQDSEW